MDVVRRRWKYQTIGVSRQSVDAIARRPGTADHPVYVRRRNCASDAIFHRHPTR